MPSPKRNHPKVSVNELAHFMVSTDTTRMSIIQRAKKPKAYVVTRYRDARDAVCAYLAELDPKKARGILAAAEGKLQQKSIDSSETALHREDAQLSLEVINSVQAMQNSLAPYRFLPAPQSPQKLVIKGVEVSVRSDLLVHGSTKGIDQIGAAVLRMTKDDTTTPRAKQKRKDMGLYVATLVLMHVQANLSGHGRQPANRLCMSIDIQHGEVFVAPTANKMRMRNIENACMFIRALWSMV